MCFITNRIFNNNAYVCDNKQLIFFDNKSCTHVIMLFGFGGRVFRRGGGICSHLINLHISLLLYCLRLRGVK
jgi:hypothetical protein